MAPVKPNTANAGKATAHHGNASPNAGKNKQGKPQVGIPKTGFASPSKGYQRNRVVLFIGIVSCGVTLSYVKKPHSDKGAFILPALQKAGTDEDFAESLCLNRVVSRNITLSY